MQPDHPEAWPLSRSSRLRRQPNIVDGIRAHNSSTYAKPARLAYRRSRYRRHKVLPRRATSKQPEGACNYCHCPLGPCNPESINDMEFRVRASRR
jgi:hypothetical protein